MSAMSASMTSSRNGSISEANESSYLARRPSVGEVFKEDQDLAEGPPKDAGELPDEPDFDETDTTEPNEVSSKEGVFMRRVRERVGLCGKEMKGSGRDEDEE